MRWFRLLRRRGAERPGRATQSPADPSLSPRTRATAPRREHGEETASGVPREVLRQVRQIELRTRGWVDSVFGGEYQSVFKGQGMEFAEVREYQPGDDVRSIDWNVTARMASPFVKKHIEERELTVLLAVDLSGSKQFGTRERFKAELAAEIAAVLALSAVRNNDRVGLLIFTDRIEHFVPPRKGRRHVLRLIRDVLAFDPVGTGTDLQGALDYAGRVLRDKSIVFVLSDFQVPWDPSPDAAASATAVDAGSGVDHTLRLIARRHDLVAVTIGDAAEEALPDAGVLGLIDPESGEELVIDTGRAALRTQFSAEVAVWRDTIRGHFRRLGIDTIEVRTGESYINPLLGFFRQRERKLKR